MREYSNKPVILTIRIFDKETKSSKLIHKHTNYWYVSVKNKVSKDGKYKYNVITLGSKTNSQKKPGDGKPRGLYKTPIDEESIKSVFKEYINGSAVGLQYHLEAEGVLVSVDLDYLGETCSN